MTLILPRGFKKKWELDKNIHYPPGRTGDSQLAGIFISTFQSITHSWDFNTIVFLASSADFAGSIWGAGQKPFRQSLGKLINFSGADFNWGKHSSPCYPTKSFDDFHFYKIWSTHTWIKIKMFESRCQWD